MNAVCSAPFIFPSSLLSLYIHLPFFLGFDLGGKYAGSLHHRPMRYDLPPYAPPLPSYEHAGGGGRAYGSPNLPFISYGFKPVASPYGNITHQANNGLYANRRYAKEIPDHVLDALEEMYARNNYKREAVRDQ